MNFVQLIVLTAGVLIAIFLVSSLINVMQGIVNRSKINILDKKLSKWFISKKDLIRLPAERFDIWCINLLYNMEIESITNSGEMLQGIYNNSPVYIKCIKLGLKKPEPGEKDYDPDDDEHYREVGRPDLQKFIGSMYHDDVSQGIIITTGYFSKEALEYAEKLPNTYKLKLIDGDSLNICHFEALKGQYELGWSNC